jgi:tetratricopeptide (TPR) repeat protein
VGRSSAGGVEVPSTVHGRTALWALALATGAAGAGYWVGRSEGRRTAAEPTPWTAEAGGPAVASVGSPPPTPPPSAPAVQQASLRSEAQPSARTPVGAAGEAASGTSTVRSERQVALREELTRLLRSGRVEAHLDTDPGTLRRFLLQRYLALAEYDAAVQLLERSGGTSGDWWRLYESLDEARDGERARLALERGLETFVAGDPGESVVPRSGGRNDLDRMLQRLGRVDPAALSRWVQRLDREAPGSVPADELTRARYLLLAGRSGEAEALVSPLLQHPLGRAQVLELLGQGDPAVSESVLRTILAQGGADPSLTVALGQNLVRQGRAEEVPALVERLLLEGQDPRRLTTLDSLLEELPEELIAERLDGWLEHPDLARIDAHSIGVVTRAVEIYGAVGRPQQALELQLRLLEGIAQRRVTAQELPLFDEETVRRNGDRLLPALRSAEAGAGGNDELWGDLADHYWLLGRPDDARRCWEQAYALDPDDSEWLGALSSLQLGEEP